ncbi:MAG: LTA synthase family protein [Ruminococcaceae bacterium]|nr:LTA synthase family protein [Oscillospiraceae bacterium]
MNIIKKLRKKITEVTKNDLAAVFLAAFILFIQTFFVFSLWKAGLDLILPNCFMFIPLYMAAYLLIRRHTICYGIISVIQFFLYYLNLYVFSSRGTPVQFGDIYCISDALSVAGNYPLVFNGSVLLVLLGVVILNALIWFLFAQTEYKRFSSYKKSGIKFPLLFIAASIPILAATILSINAPPFSLTEYTSKTGLPLAIFSEYLNSIVQPPQGYTKEQAEKVLSGYTETAGGMSEPINIIVIMNESLADYSLLGETGFPEDPMPYYHSLEENCVKGRLLVSVYGGSTCNTEFEFLTGASLAFLPPSSLPYNQYMNGGIHSICKDEALSGYTKTAIHPYFAGEWRRNSNYPIMGFDDFISGEDFSENYVKGEYEDIAYMGLEFADFGSDLEYVRKFISDKECYRKILQKQDESNANGKPSFIFAVTIQNHGSYQYEDFEAAEYTDDDIFNQYLTLTSISDSALEYLLAELSERDEKTVVVMFGDHQPGIDVSLASADMSGINKYITPYIMWANFDMEWDVPEITSPNFLSLYLKKNIGIPLTKWDQVRLNAAEGYPAVSCEYAAAAGDGSIVDTSSIIGTDAFKDYQFVQYEMMFDN